MLFKPTFVAIAGILVWMFVWLVSPLNYLTTLSLSTWVFLAMGYGCFFLGSMIATLTNNPFVKAAKTIAQPTKFNMPLFAFSSAMAIISFLLILYDRIVVRQVDFSDSSDKVRETLATSEFSAYSAIGTLIQAFSFMPLILLLLRKFERRQLPFYALAIILFMLPAISSLVQLSRSVLLMSIVLGFATVCCIKFNGNPIDRRILGPSAAVFIATMIISASIFNARLEDYDRKLEDSVVDSVYAYAIKPYQTALNGMYSENPLVSGYYKTTVPIEMYYLSGMYEFDLLLNRSDGQKFAYGTYLLSPYIKVIDRIFNTDYSVDVSDGRIDYRSGVFITFFGPIWMDFGWISIFFLVAFGFASEKLAVAAKARYTNVIPLYLYMIVLIFFMPVFCVLASGFGFFAAQVFIAYAALGPRST